MSLHSSMSAKAIRNRIERDQQSVRPITLEERLESTRDLLARADSMGATADMKARWQNEVEMIELQLETEKALEIVAANLNQFLHLRRAIALVYADEVFYADEPTDADLRQIEAEEKETASYDFLNETSLCSRCDHPTEAHQPMCLVMIDNGVACECVSTTSSSPGSRFIVSGGDVQELDMQAGDEGEEGMPF
jgi:hypothetical protein